MITRAVALALLKKHVKSKNVYRHSLACEAVMKTLAIRFNAEVVPIPLSEEEWGIVGLLHDIDYEETKEHPEIHTSVLEQEVKDIVDPEMLYAMKSHNWQYNKVEPKSLMDWSIFCCDELTGFILACAYAHESKHIKKISSLYILNRLNDKSFMPDANRQQIQMCEWKLNIPLAQFIEITLMGMQAISVDLGFKEPKTKKK
jgi:predicted hydrolase (HD superfamily)